MGGEERAEQGDERIQRSAEGFEEAPVGLFGGDGCDALFARGTRVGGFFLALSLAFASGRAALPGSFRRDGGCEGGGDVFDVLCLAALGTAFDGSCEVSV